MVKDEALEQEMLGWRHALHQHPEVGFQEVHTAAFVAKVVKGLGFDVHCGIGGTGLVASLTVGEGTGVIGVRADMDALAMTETATNRPHVSRKSGCMHGCGHDGHMAMVLGAALLLSRSRDFNGTVRLIFQPAEEHGCGANAMIRDGLFEHFPVDEIYGVHNIPGMPVGHIATRAGGIMASEDNFVIRIHGRGGHAARPQMAVDPLVIAAEIILALQTIIGRSVDPSDSAVVSCTEIHSDGIRNSIPTHVEIKGDTRSYSPEVQALLERRIRELCTGIASAHGATCEVEYTHEFVPTVNWPECTLVAIQAAQRVVGPSNVDGNVAPMMISEDFGAFLRVVPGAFAFIGNGASGTPGGVPLHNGQYDFNDEILSIGARYFAELVRTQLKP
ncbi:amidohydrolase [Candidimonas nitroreducens]|uniref:Amidohydrolase n=2 Tax=Candidimonas nitroreducens TaxID=683354 RepID=A0A225MEJ1_9BURK|nr:amidohydrolase [Candidimonas nitroreducens]